MSTMNDSENKTMSNYYHYYSKIKQTSDEVIQGSGDHFEININYYDGMTNKVINIKLTSTISNQNRNCTNVYLPYLQKNVWNWNDIQLNRKLSELIIEMKITELIKQSISQST